MTVFLRDRNRPRAMCDRGLRTMVAREGARDPDGGGDIHQYRCSSVERRLHGGWNRAISSASRALVFTP